jgi:small basic protein (TIGR04137 family)
MSIHPSLRGVDTLSGNRSVFSRVERIQKLIKEGKLSEDDSPHGLPKVRTVFKVKKARKDPEEEAAAEGAEPAAEGETPAAE